MQNWMVEKHALKPWAPGLGAGHRKDGAGAPLSGPNTSALLESWSLEFHHHGTPLVLNTIPPRQGSHLKGKSWPSWVWFSG